MHAMAAILDFPIRMNLNNTCVPEAKEHFKKSFVTIASAVLEKKFKMSQPIRGQGGHLGFSDPRENIQHLSGTT